MTAANQQILEAYETLGLEPEQIAEQFDYEVAAVKSVLAQFSRKFRGDVEIEDNKNFSETELEAANRVIVDLMMTSEDERLRARLACYVRDDKKGRLDAVKQMAGLNVNVVMINDQMRKAQAAIARSKGVASRLVNGELVNELPETIDV